MLVFGVFGGQHSVGAGHNSTGNCSLVPGPEKTSTSSQGGFLPPQGGGYDGEDMQEQEHDYEREHEQEKKSESGDSDNIDFEFECAEKRQAYQAYQAAQAAWRMAAQACRAQAEESGQVEKCERRELIATHHALETAHDQYHAVAARIRMNMRVAAESRAQALEIQSPPGSDCERDE